MLPPHFIVSTPSSQPHHAALVRWIGSNPNPNPLARWIGSLELGLFLEHALGVECRTASYQSGDDVAADGRRLAHHFETQGTPVMIGGGQLAFTLLGVHWDPTSGDIRYLIMDPHYTGADELSSIHPKWVGWKSADSLTHLGTKLFDKDVFYNLCFPQRPSCI